jgi:hypothetical protein
MIVKSILSNVFIFATGAAVGSLVAWRLIKSRYERMANEEIATMKEYYATKIKKYSGPEQSEPSMGDTETPIEEESEQEITVDDYHEKLVESGYTNHNDISSKEVKYVEKPYVIMPEDFGEIEGYETISLTLYADGVLTDDFDDPIEDIEHTVGRDSLTHFGEYEDDSVFVRNDRLKCDYEILTDHRKYSAVVDSKSRLTEE